ncbi:type 2 DNA topoisomerase 6 subunit B-like isoform X2 [Arapaima gigas]
MPSHERVGSFLEGAKRREIVSARCQLLHSCTNVPRGKRPFCERRVKQQIEGDLQQMEEDLLQMEGNLQQMEEDLLQAVRLVLVQIHRAQQWPKPVDGGLWVSASLQTGLRSPHTLSCTVAVAGLWGSVLSEADLQDELKQSLASFITLSSPGDPEELGTFTDTCGPLQFHLSFQVRSRHESGKLNWSRVEQFLHRLSLVHAQVEIYFTLKINEAITQQVLRSTPDCRFTLMGCSMITDTTSYLLGTLPVGPVPQCAKLHLVPGRSTPLQLPLEVAEMCGVISLLPVGALSPCVDQYPNQPACIYFYPFLNDHHIFLYGPSNLPLLHDDGEDPLHFLCSLTHFLSLEEFGLSGVQFIENTPKGTVCSDTLYTVDRNEQGDAVKQSLLLFLFLQHSDPFHCQLSDFTDCEDVLVQNLDLILQHNKGIVKSALHSVLISTLRGSLKRKKASNCITAQEKIQAALPVILTSLSSVVNSSSSLDFRTACLKSMKVENTQELRAALQQSLWGVVEGRSIPSRKCSSNKAQSVKSRPDAQDVMVSKQKGKMRKKHQSENICGAHSCPDQGLSVEMPKSQTGWKSCIHKRQPESSSHQSGHKQRTALSPLQAALGEPAAAEHVACNTLAVCSPEQNEQEAATWLQMFEWD